MKPIPLILKIVSEYDQEIPLILKPRFLDLHLSISNDTVSTQIYNKRDEFDFEIVNFPFLDDYVPRYTYHRVYIYQLFRFTTASSHVADFNTRNTLLTQKLLNKALGVINFAFFP